MGTPSASLGCTFAASSNLGTLSASLGRIRSSLRYFVLLLLRLLMNPTSVASKATAINPPTAPPAIAPTFDLLELECEPLVEDDEVD